MSQICNLHPYICSQFQNEQLPELDWFAFCGGTTVCKVTSFSIASAPVAVLVLITTYNNHTALQNVLPSSDIAFCSNSSSPLHRDQANNQYDNNYNSSRPKQRRQE
jgi:hypothetical protein